MVVMYGAPPPPPDGPNRFFPFGPVWPVVPAPPPPVQPPVNPLIGCGWECPRCKSINAPYVTKCDCKPGLVPP
jgi:hypothetical protein